MSQAIQPETDDRAPAIRRPGLVNQKDRIGFGVLILMFLGGLWLMVAPFLVGYQSRGGDWSDGTLNEFAVGGGLAVVALVTIVWIIAGTLHELSRSQEAKRVRTGSENVD